MLMRRASLLLFAATGISEMIKSASFISTAFNQTAGEALSSKLRVHLNATAKKKFK